MVPFLEGRVVRSSLEEIDKGTIQVTKGLLEGDGRDIREPGVLLLESGEHGREIVVVEALSLLSIGRLAGRESPVVDEAATSERLSQDDPLLSGRIEAEFVGALRLLAHCLFAFLLLFYMLLKSIDGLAVSRSLILFSHLLESLQKRRIEVNRKALCLHTGSISLSYLCFKELQAPVPKPHKRNAAYIP